jgi:DNA repair exonuclease SbcCD ATPase subunit
MLKKITIKNFRKHTNSVFSFEDGLSVMRGANEAGKSTLLEAIAYALFGVKALRSPLAEAVTWGEPENTLKVVLEISVDFIDYVISRGKSGAEINYDGGTVTGQTEVTNFIAAKLKVDSNSAAKLMLSTQMDIRGALEAGPKATTELSERLAEFDQIDRLIELIQEKLSLGSADGARQLLAAAQEKLARANEAVQPDFAGLNQRVVGCQSSVELAQAEVAKAKVSADAARTLNSQAQAAGRDYSRLTTQGQALQRKLEECTNDSLALNSGEPAIVVNPDEQIQSAIAARTALSNAAIDRRAYAEVKDLLGKQEVEYFKGDLEALEGELAAARTQGSARERSALGYDAEIAKLQGKLLLNSCTFCGKDFSDVPEVQAKNAGTQKLIDEFNALRRAAIADARTALDRVTMLGAFTKSARIVEATVTKYLAYLQADRSTVPAILTWNPAIVITPAGEVEPDYDAVIRQVRAAVKARADWEQSLRDNAATGARVQKELAEVNAAREALPKVDLLATETAEHKAVAALQDAQETLDDMRRSLSTAQSTLREETLHWEWVSKARAEAEAGAASAQAALKALEFNNALLKKVRAARPIIADKLWNLVLAAVSTYFSEMRGARAQVTKTSDGFLVDGHPVQSLSGSTLDILGLAIRVALVRTFLPQAPFLVLDEPCASMDTARTEALLGFLVAVGFKQVLLVTHEDVSESVADHIIAIGE